MSAGADVLAKVLVVAALVIMGVFVVDDDLEDAGIGADHRSEGGSPISARLQYQCRPRR